MTGGRLTTEREMMRAKKGGRLRTGVFLIQALEMGNMRLFA